MKEDINDDMIRLKCFEANTAYENKRLKNKFIDFTIERGAWYKTRAGRRALVHRADIWAAYTIDGDLEEKRCRLEGEFKGRQTVLCGTEEDLIGYWRP